VVRLAAVLLLTAGVLLLLAACGGSARPAATPQKKIVVAALGDAITAGSPGFNPSHGDAKLLGQGENPKSQWEYWAQRKDPRLEIRNCGVYGQRTDEIARRVGSCARGAQVLVVQGGINDLQQGRTPAQAAANLRGMVVRGKTLGLQVEVAELIPWNNGHPTYDAEIRGLNRRIHAIGRDEHVRVLPFYSVLSDPGRPGQTKDRWTAEGDNPSVDGYRRLGEMAFRLP
jgi:lysophospholipase L1-like esterase